MRPILPLLLLLCLVLPVLAQEPPLPQPRPQTGVETAVDEDVAPPEAEDAEPETEAEIETDAEPAPPLVPLPRPRPAPPAAEPAADEAAAAGPDASAGENENEGEADPTPAPPARDYQTACPAVMNGEVEAEALPPIRDGQCFAAAPLSLHSALVNGRMLAVSGGVVTDCGMATALPRWLAAVDSWLAAREDTRIAELIVGTSYMCRNVNNAATGNLSFHGFANALDIVGFRLEDGRTVTVEADWGELGPQGSEDGRIIRFAHAAACSTFTTVLGPDANALHHDHLHLDLGCHGRSCTARICE